MFKFALIIAFITSAQAQTNIAILDNQIDIHHDQLSHFVWNNKLENINGLDDDSNGFIDDVNGWNFIENSGEIFNYDLYGSFPHYIYRYYDLRAKKSLETITKPELREYNQIKNKEDFKEVKKSFSKYIHGTHISCLIMDMKGNPKSISKSDFQFIPIRYLGSATEGAFKAPEFIPLTKGSESQKIKHIEQYLSNYIVWMIGKLELAISYVENDVQVINASWGQGFSSAKSMITDRFKQQFEKDDIEKFEEKITQNTHRYLSTLTQRGGQIIKRNKKILFIFSAGNKKEDTDTQIHYPSSIVSHNLISVAASDHKQNKAYFSNFGARTVSTFAPGMAIESCTPDKVKIRINGTSQAAPQVSSLAMKLFEIAKKINIKVTPGQVKKIVVETSDIKESLKDLSTNSGIINAKRAFKATELLLDHKLDEAIKLARTLVNDL